MLIPSPLNQAASLSNTHPDPNAFDVDHSASRAFTTNQPSSAGARPEPESSSRAPGIAASLTSRQAPLEDVGPAREQQPMTSGRVGMHRARRDPASDLRSVERHPAGIELADPE